MQSKPFIDQYLNILQSYINRLWYQKHFLSYVLYPFSLLYRLISVLRFYAYQSGSFRSYYSDVPVIVVGNITVGGTGKTPLVIALTNYLKDHGFKPGIITRGYGGKSTVWPQRVTANSNAIVVGDEAVLMAKRTGVPVMAGPKRIDSVKRLSRECDVIISDDGLQHYALKRDIEIAVIDGQRRLGNGFCLPAGPLREPKKRLKQVDFVVANGGAKLDEYAMEFVFGNIVNVVDPEKQTTFSDLIHRKIIALAGIGNPDRFFQGLRDKGLQFETRVFPDHHHFKSADIDCANDTIVLMTEKDMVKCTQFSDQRHWMVQGHAVLPGALLDSIVLRLNKVHNTANT